MSLAQVMMGAQVVGVIRLIFWLLQILVLARVVISWIRVSPHHPLVRFIHDTTEPMLRPLRAVVRVGSGGLDFSPLLLLLILLIAERLIVTLVAG